MVKRSDSMPSCYSSRDEAASYEITPEQNGSHLTYNLNIMAITRIIF